MGKIIVDNIQTQNVVFTSTSTPSSPIDGQLYYEPTHSLTKNIQTL